jgi:N utilization substance protein B
MTLRAETRHRARTAQLLYAWEAQDRPPVARTASALLARHPRCRGAIERAEVLATEVAYDIEALDEELASAVDHWRLERIGTMERAILRLALFELRRDDTPPKVVITEAVKLAHWFAGGGAPAFINGVLDAVARRTGRL